MGAEARPGQLPAGGAPGFPPPPGCDAHLHGEVPSLLDGRCRCVTCTRCGHHAASYQGHYWGWCKATGAQREFHFCCPDPRFGCELEYPGPRPPATPFP